MTRSEIIDEGEASAFVADKCRECKKRSIDSAVESNHFCHPRRIVVYSQMATALALLSTAAIRPLTVGVGVLYETTRYSAAEDWYSWRCEDPPCLLATLRQRDLDAARRR